MSFKLPRRTFKPSSLSSRSRSSQQLKNRWFKWLAPGLFIKRWLFLSALGGLLFVLGLAIWTKQAPVFRLSRFIGNLLAEVTDLIPNSVSGPMVLGLGLLMLFWGQTRTLGAITEVLMPDGDEELVDRLVAYRRLHRGPKLVALGGGTGLSTLLRGLKHYSTNITAIVTVADDGGSSGRLRREIGILPPGDIRNCLAALADEEKLLTELFQYRFKAGNGLEGHSFGNLFLTAMNEVTGDLERAIATSSKVLAIKGEVLPATLSDVKLWATLTDGRRIEGESSITEAGGQIASIGCIPTDPPALPRAIQAIHEADYITIGPGSLYTSIIPNLLVPDIAEAIAHRRVPCIYICNIMTQKGETEGYSVADHIRAIDRACGRPLFDAVLVQRRSPSAETLIEYAKNGSTPVFFDRPEILALGRRIVVANVMDEINGRIRHNSNRLAGVLMRWFSHH
ncbi:MAG: gluconeogenesis factor YvcK family protein [Leptolyngbyaceae bacterium]|nr:gluconeogenesis factor YvcK family protein [Leptolyngbyaceae bacterium]